MRTFSLPVGTLAVALAWAGAACSDAVSPETAVVEEGLVLSEIVETPDARVVYVSLRAGTVPAGVQAKVRNVGTGAALQSPMVDGGLDPVALAASEGDSIEVQTRDQEGELRFFGATVSLSKPPVVVRSGPSRGAVDVGLNSVILVVFSEPVDSQTLSPETIGLTLDGESVPIEVTPSPDGLRAEVNPGGLLPSRTYLLIVKTGVRDRNGLNLQEEYRSTFMTLNAPAVASVEISADSLVVEVGQPLKLNVTLRDQAGKVLTDRKVTWIVTSPASVGPGDTARMMAPGEAGLVAQVERVSASITLRAGPLRFQQVSAGDEHTCAITAPGFAYCWGRNSRGQVGVGDTASRRSPAAVSGARIVRSLSTGSESTCALDEGGEAYCWGLTRLPTTGGEAEVHWVPFLSPYGLFTAISVGQEQWCGTDQAGLYCWGYFPEPIDPLTMEGGWFLDGPYIFASDPPITGLSTGDRHSCGLTPDGRGICWGVNTLGQLGDGTLNHTPTIVGAWPNLVFEPQLATVSTDVRFTQIASGSTHTCALDGSGGAYCWGDNREGQLGTAPGTECTWSDVTGPYNCRTTPAPVSGSLVFRSISAGFRFTCGITTQGGAYCWGQNAHGQLGNGGRTSATAPSPVGGGLLFEDVSAGTDHACGLTTDGRLYCWGRGLEGQLGNGQTSDALLPVAVAMQVGPTAPALRASRK